MAHGRPGAVHACPAPRCKHRKPAAAAALLELLAERPQGAPRPDASRIAALVDELVAAGDGAPFKEELLGGGPWVVRATSFAHEG